MFSFFRTLTSAAAVAIAASSGAAQGLSGDYLAGRSALGQYDYANAAQYLTRALASDRNNLELLNRSMSAFLASGDVDGAMTLATAAAGQVDVVPLAGLLLLGREIETGDFDAAAARLETGRVSGASIDQLLSGWVKMGQGQVSAALGLFDEAAKNEGIRNFALYQKALALSLVGDFESAEGIFDNDLTAPSLRGSLARAQILAQMDRRADAIAYLDQVHGDNGDPQALALKARLQAGVAVEFNLIQSPADGAGEVLFSLASALQGDGGEDGLLIYARLAQHLAPRNIHALLLTAELLEGLGNHQMATAVYDQVPRSHPAYVTAEMGRAEAFYQIGQTDVAVDVIADLAQAFPAVRSVHFMRGNLLRREERYAEAVEAYDTAISMVQTPSQSNWFQYYVRAISHHKQDNWPAAEADFRAALALSPGEARVLNYLGYSLVERGEKLPEALEMIQQAVTAAPNAGYIIDSLGWAQFTLGKYEDAVVNLERAAELMATDPIVNDHLGDAYWAVGRAIEARFQWRRALSFINDDTDLSDIDPADLREKLKNGLDLPEKANGDDG